MNCTHATTEREREKSMHLCINKKSGYKFLQINPSPHSINQSRKLSLEPDIIIGNKLMKMISYGNKKGNDYTD